MRNALKAAAVAVICCAGVAFADPAATDQAPTAPAANGNTVVVADTGNSNDPPPRPDGMRVLIERGGPDKNADQNQSNGRDGRGGRGGPMMGMRGRMGEWMMQRGHERQHGEAGAMQPRGLMLGVATDSADPALSSQLNLPDGIGLVVEQVLPYSAAQSAGVQKYDLLEKLDDQIVVNAEQVSVLIKMHKPGDKLTLTVIRHGKPMELTATLSVTAQRSTYPGYRTKPQTGNRGSGATPDTSGAPTYVPPPPRMEIPPRADERSDIAPAAAMQPTAAISDVLQQFAELFVD